MSEYFLNRLYGGPEFDALAAQIERLLKYAHKAEKSYLKMQLKQVLNR